MAQRPSTQFDTPRSRKKRKVSTSAVPQPSQPTSEDVLPSSPCEGSPTTVLKSTSQAVALPLSGPTTSNTASQAENMEAGPAADPVGTSRKKRKKRNSVPLEKGPSAEPAASNSGDVTMSPHTRKKRRKGQPAVPVIPTGTRLPEILSVQRSHYFSRLQRHPYWERYRYEESASFVCVIHAMQETRDPHRTCQWRAPLEVRLYGQVSKSSTLIRPNKPRPGRKNLDRWMLVGFHQIIRHHFISQDGLSRK